MDKRKHRERECIAQNNLAENKHTIHCSITHHEHCNNSGKDGDSPSDEATEMGADLPVDEPLHHDLPRQCARYRRALS